MKNNYYTYDLECYPNIFTFCGKFLDSNEVQMFEISDRVNELQALMTWLSYLRNAQVEMVGYNNIGFDYFLIHELMTNPYTFTYLKAAQLTDTIINSFNGKGLKRIRPSDRLIPQIDLYKLCHFDNANKRTSLKALQFAMRSESVEDLPFDIRDLNDQEKDQLKTYNIHDVTETEKYLIICKPLIDMRREYLNDGILRGDVLNFNDVKIGTEYLVSKLGRGRCFKGGKPRQSFRESISFANIILPKIHFRTQLYDDVLTWFKQQVVYTHKGASRPSHQAKLAGLDFHFGLGGVHASVNNKIFKSNETHQIIDIDVAGMYVAVAIENRFAPEHLGTAYVEAYRQVKEDRARYPKGSSMNAMLKLSGNGVYGKSNDVYSCFYDPQYTFSVTSNGQLQLLQLVEMISLIPDCEFIQANTDGITLYINKENIHLFKMWCGIWEEMTGLVLEELRYSRMWIRDVNNYISEMEDGKLKRKGAYWYPLNEKEYEGWWNKDYSNLASKRAAEKLMTHSWSVETAIRLVTDPFDFMLRYKATGSSKLYIGETKQLKTVRYYVAHNGEAMKKISAPKGEIGQYKRASKLKDDFFNKILEEIGRDVWDERIHTKNKSKYAMTTTSVQAGWKVKQCNKASDFNWNDVDWTYYIEEAKKIVIGSK